MDGLIGYHKYLETVTIVAFVIFGALYYISAAIVQNQTGRVDNKKEKLISLNQFTNIRGAFVILFSGRLYHATRENRSVLLLARLSLIVFSTCAIALIVRTALAAISG